MIIDSLVENLFSHRRFTLNSYEISVVGIQFCDLNVCKDVLRFNMKTPAVTYITTKEKKTVWFSPEDERFFDIVKNNLRNKYNLIFGEEYAGTLSFTCDHCTPKFECVTKCKGNYINAWPAALH